jgi:GntR family transcriptional regulator
MGMSVAKSPGAIARPLYSQVRDLLLARVRAGEWSAGETLPNEFVLASSFGVSIGTVRRAIEGLEELGVVVRKQGRGTYVAGSGPRALLDKFMPWRGIDGQHLDLKYQLLSLNRRSIRDDERKRFPARSSDTVIEIEQLVTAGGDPVGHERSIVLAEKFPRIETQLKYGQFLYDLFSDYGVLVTQVVDTLSMAPAENAGAPAFFPNAGMPLLRADRLTFTLDRQAVEFRRSFFDMAQLSYQATHE